MYIYFNHFQSVICTGLIADVGGAGDSVGRLFGFHMGMGSMYTHGNLIFSSFLKNYESIKSNGKSILTSFRRMQT